MLMPSFAVPGVAQITPCLSSSDEDIRRLAAGALLALCVDQAGKVAAIEVRTQQPAVLNKACLHLHVLTIKRSAAAHTLLMCRLYGMTDGNGVGRAISDSPG